MRVTENTNFDVIRESIKRSKGRMEELQKQQATLKKLNAPSDDPVGAAKVLMVRTDKVNNDQYVTNAKLAQSYLENTDHAVGELADIVVRAKELAIQQANGPSSSEASRLGTAEEVKQLYLDAVSVANRRIGDRYIFGGFKVNQPPVDGDGNYQGDHGQAMVEISKDVFISMNIPGIEAFNTKPEFSVDAQRVGLPNGQRRPASVELGEEAMSAPENINVFDELQNFRINLLTGDLDGVRNTLERFDQMHATLLAMRAKVGSRMNGIDNATGSIERQNLTNSQLTSSIEDADMAQVVSDLAKEETVFRSALSSSQKLVQPTLLEFLK